MRNYRNGKSGDERGKSYDQSVFTWWFIAEEGSFDGVLSVLLPLSSASKFHTLIVKKPTVVVFADFNGILSLKNRSITADQRHDQWWNGNEGTRSSYLGVSWTAFNVTIALPIGVAVWLTRSRTSYAVILTFVSKVSPSLARKLTVVRKPGLLLRCNL